MRRNNITFSVIVSLLLVCVFSRLASADVFLPNGTVGVKYSTYLDNLSSVSGMQLPPGLTARKAGVRIYIEGTPTKAGTYTLFTRLLNDSKRGITSNVKYKIVIKPQEANATQNNSKEFKDDTMTLKRMKNLNEGKVGQVYRETIRVNVKDPNLGYSPFSARLIKGSLPPGVKLSADSSGYWAYLEGTAKQAGTYSFTVRLLNKRKGYQDMSFTIKITK